MSSTWYTILYIQYILYRYIVQNQTGKVVSRSDMHGLWGLPGQLLWKSLFIYRLAKNRSTLLKHANINYLNMVTWDKSSHFIRAYRRYLFYCLSLEEEKIRFIYFSRIWRLEFGIQNNSPLKYVPSNVECREPYRLHSLSLLHHFQWLPCV